MPICKVGFVCAFWHDRSSILESKPCLLGFAMSTSTNGSLKNRFFLTGWKVFGYSPLYPTYGTLVFFSSNSRIS